MLNPHEIQKKQFTVVRLREGYAAPEVDAFLDEVLVSYREVMAELEGYRRADTAVLPTAVIPNEITQASRLLELAQQAADDQAVAAVVSRDQILDGARQSGQQIIQDAKVEAARLVEEGTKEKHSEVGRLEDMRAKLQVQVNEWNLVVSKLKKQLKAALEAVE